MRVEWRHPYLVFRVMDLVSSLLTLPATTAISWLIAAYLRHTEFSTLCPAPHAWVKSRFETVFRIWIVRFFAVMGIRIRVFLGLPDPDPLVKRYGSGSFPFLINVSSTEKMPAK
jgi:hypothetical protein